MSEIISIHIGQAGVQIGNSFWDLLCLEHGISADGNYISGEKREENEALKKIFCERHSGKFIPRSLFVDLEPQVIDEIKSGQQSKLFSEDQFLTGKEGAFNLYARGCYTVGDEIIEQCMDRIRKIADSCESLQGFIIFHSVGGGTGSGFGANLTSNLSVKYEKKSKIGITVYPSPQATSAILESYNAVLSTSNLVDQLEVCILMDNEALYDICKNKADIENPQYTNLNKIIAYASASLTASIRYNGPVNYNLNEISMNLVPYPDLHFMLCSCSSVLQYEQKYQHSLSTSNITNSAFDPTNIMLKCDPKNSKYLACSMFYRGDNTQKQVIQALSNIKEKQTIQFVDWVPTGFKVGINYSQPYVVSGDQFMKINRDACLISNSLAIQQVFARILNKFDLMYAKKPCVHWYCGEGMDEGEFYSSREEIANLVEQYEKVEGYKDDSFEDG